MKTILRRYTRLTDKCMSLQFSWFMVFGFSVQRVVFGFWDLPSGPTRRVKVVSGVFGVMHLGHGKSIDLKLCYKIPQLLTVSAWSSILVVPLSRFGIRRGFYNHI